MSKIVIFKGYRKRPKHRSHKRRGHKRRRSYGSAQRSRFSAAAKSCGIKLRGKWSRSKMSACMKKALKKR